MAVVIYSAGFILRRFPETNRPGESVVVGFLALGLSVCTELGLATVLQDQNLGEYIGSRDKISGSVYLALLVVFALMPRMRLRTNACNGRH